PLRRNPEGFWLFRAFGVPGGKLASVCQNSRRIHPVSIFCCALAGGREWATSSDASQSRFFSWAIEREHAEVNPVRMIPIGKRPQQAQKRGLPWLKDDQTVVELMA